jgi:hypothetical protein
MYAPSSLKHENSLPRAGIVVPLADMMHTRLFFAVDLADLIARAEDASAVYRLA